MIKIPMYQGNMLLKCCLVMHKVKVNGYCDEETHESQCDRGPTFQVTNLNRNLTQFRPSEIHCQPDPTERNGSLRHLTTRNVF